MKILKRLLCKHENLYFVKYLHGDQINAHGGKRFEYACFNCGASVFLDHPIDCVHCRCFYFLNDGSGCCSRADFGKSCISNKRYMWEEKTEENGW